MPTKSQSTLQASTTRRSGRDVCQRNLYGQEEVPTSPTNPPKPLTIRKERICKSAQPSPPVTNSKHRPPKERAAAVTKAVKESKSSEEESEASKSSRSYLTETEDIDTSKACNVPYDGLSRKTL